MKQAYDDSKQRYGAVKICRVLNDNGTPYSVKRVQRHMAEQGLRSIVIKKCNHHSSHGGIPEDKKNILGRDFGAETISQKWCTDITYIHVQKEGWDLSGFCHGSVQPKDYRACLWRIYDGGTGS